jgi:hypothetical protein
MTAPTIASITPATAELLPGQTVTFVVDAGQSDVRKETFTVFVRDSAGRESDPIEVPLTFRENLSLVVNQPAGSLCKVEVSEKNLVFTVTNPA